MSSSSHGDRITLAHGNGGRRTRELVEQVFAEALADLGPDLELDAAPVTLLGDDWAVSVDGFTVQPLEFPGGDIGALAVHGTCNDLAVSGAEPHVLTLSAMIEEGLEVEVLRRIVQSLAAAARGEGVAVLAGDTKVVPRGHGGGLYLTTTGIGRAVRRNLSPHAIAPGDRLLVSGPVGDHGISVLFARESFDLHGDLRSDCGSVTELCRAAWAVPSVRFLRDPTRGGIATVVHELAVASGHTLVLDEASLPVHEPVQGVCDILGYDPYYLACEGRVVAVVGSAEAEGLLARWRAVPGGEGAALVGEVEAGEARAVLRTRIGGRRVLHELEDDPLPRIC